MASDGSDLVILADTNIQNPRPATLEECLGRAYKLVRVTTLSSLKAFSPIPGSLRYLVLGCLSPLITELSGVQDADDRELALGEASLALIDLIKSWIAQNPSLFVMIVPPLPRSHPVSYKEDSSAFMASILAFSDDMPQVRILSGYSVTRNNYQKDGVTLLHASMVRYVESIFPVVRSIMEARAPTPPPAPTPLPVQEPVGLNTTQWDETMYSHSGISSTPRGPGGNGSYVVEVTQETPVSVPCYGTDVTSVQLVDPENVSLQGLATAMNSFFVDFLVKCLKDNEEFARAQEADCYRENCRQNDKVIVNGYQGVTYPSSQSERNTLFRPMVASTIQQVLGRDEEFTIYGRNGDMKGNNLPPVEIRFLGGAEVAEDFRRDGSRMSKERRPGVSHLYFNSCTTLATRVRIEVFRALSTKLTSGNQVAYCVTTQAKPYLSVGPAQMTPNTHRKTYRYVEAIKAFGRLLEVSNLDRAYERAGPHFAGRLEMVFLVLSEKGAKDYREKRAAAAAAGNNNRAPYAPGAKRSNADAAGPSAKRS